jgi:hypothetical protein
VLSAPFVLQSGAIQVFNNAVLQLFSAPSLVKTDTFQIQVSESAEILHSNRALSRLLSCCAQSNANLQVVNAPKLTNINGQFTIVVRLSLLSAVAVVFTYERRLFASSSTMNCGMSVYLPSRTSKLTCSSR